MKSSLPKIIRYLVMLALLLAAAVYASSSLLLPVPAPETSPSDTFSAETAFRHLYEISREKHPAGSEAATPVVDYLVNSLKISGIEASIQKSSEKRGDKVYPVQNVLARIPGKNPGPALLIVTHFDSTPFGQGAGDNGSGTAVLLETARAIKAGPPMENDLILLFEDGEELGYLGGFAFAREHPWMQDVRLAIGLDTAAWGPVVLLQTTPLNGNLVKGYAQSVNMPTAYGFFADADWNIAHDDSEILPFVLKGIPGIELEDPTASLSKHSELDVVSKVNESSMQQMGSQLVSLVRFYGASDLSQVAAPDESFFTLPGFGVIHYPAIINPVLASLVFAGMLGLVGAGLRRKSLDGKKLLLAFLASLGLVVVLGLISLQLSNLFMGWFPRPNEHIDSYLVPASLPYFSGALTLVTIIFAASRVSLSRKLGVENIAAAGLLLWGGLSLLFAFLLKVGSYGFVWLALFSLLAWTSSMVLRQTWLRRALAGIGLMGGVILFTPDMVLAFIGTGTGNLFLVAVILIMLTELYLAAVE
jgi:hypothetical protein